MAKLDELKQEAKELGMAFSPNIGESKLQEKIDEFYAAKEKEAEEENAPVTKDTAVDGQKTMGQLAKEAEDKARVTQVVTIVDNDQRENNQTTSVTVNCSNVYFDLGQIVLPLNTPVEVMQGHIDVLKEIEIPMHALDPKTRLNTLKMRKRYSISLEDKKV